MTQNSNPDHSKSGHTPRPASPLPVPGLQAAEQVSRCLLQVTPFLEMPALVIKTARSEPQPSGHPLPASFGASQSSLGRLPHSLACRKAWEGRAPGAWGEGMRRCPGQEGRRLLSVLGGRAGREEAVGRSSHTGIRLLPGWPEQQPLCS